MKETGASANMRSPGAGQPGPLAGIRVLDLTTFLSGPFCTQVLGDLGADVVKIESPDGDQTRHLPPHFIEDESLYYLSVNRNKRSVVVDLKTAQGRKLLLDLAGRSDLLIENFRPGVIERIWMPVDEVLALHPRLIWASISGFGQDGPYREYPAYDMIVQALSGGMSMTGEPEGQAVRAGIPIGDLGAGLYAAIGLLALLNARNATGRGGRIDVAMLDCQLAMLCYQASYYLHSGVPPKRQGRGHDSIPTYNTFRTRDIDVVVTANTEKMWQSMCDVLGLAALKSDPRFVTNKDRHAHREALIPLLQEAFLRQPAGHWVESLRAAGVPVAMLNSLDLAFRDPQVTHRKMVSRIASKAGGDLGVTGNPIRVDGMSTPMNYPPALGENTGDVLREWLQLDEARIRELTDQRIVAAGRRHD
jgi:crotonobetainyl-CoA:carnitine CoA-transferase CaiB-like acyl-CoA transferase